jgi:hypothetical protein
LGTNFASQVKNPNYSFNTPMDSTTGREFKHVNPQDDPDVYPELPSGFMYGVDGRIIGSPERRPGHGRRLSRRFSIQKEDVRLEFKEFLSEMLNKTIKAYHDPTVDKSAALAALFHEFNQRYYRLLHNNERHITLEQSRHILEVTSAKTTE